MEPVHKKLKLLSNYQWKVHITLPTRLSDMLRIFAQKDVTEFVSSGA